MPGTFGLFLQVSQDVVLLHLDILLAHLVCTAGFGRPFYKAWSKEAAEVLFSFFFDLLRRWWRVVGQFHQFVGAKSGYTNDAYAFWNALAVSLAGLLSVCIGSAIGPCHAFLTTVDTAKSLLVYIS